jgi:hypothetical protein
LWIIRLIAGSLNSRIWIAAADLFKVKCQRWRFASASANHHGDDIAMRYALGDILGASENEQASRNGT